MITHHILGKGRRTRCGKYEAGFPSIPKRKWPGVVAYWPEFYTAHPCRKQLKMCKGCAEKEKQ